MTVLLVALVGLNILNFIDRTLPQALIVDIVADLKLSYGQFAFMIGPMFGLVYAFTGLVMGALADRYSRPRLIAGGLLVWSAMTGAMGLAGTMVQATAARSLVAVGEATLSPSALSMLAEAFPVRRRGLVSSLYYVGVSVGAGAAYLIAATLGAAVGWRGCFLVLGAIGAVCAMFVLLLPDRRQYLWSGESQPSIGRATRDFAQLLRRSAALRWTLAAAVFLPFGLSASVLDLAWLVAERGFTKGAAQGQFGTLFIAGSLVGVLAGGPLADWCERRWGSRYPYLIAVVAIVAPASMAFRLVPSDSLAFYPCYLITAAGQTLFYAAFVPMVQALAPARLRATTIAATLLCMALLGTSLGTQAAGLLADALKRAGSAMPLSHALFAISAMALPALPAAALAWRRYAADRAQFGSVD